MALDPRDTIPDKGGPPRGTPQTQIKKVRMNAPEKLKVQKVLSALTVAVGFVLVAGKVHAHSKPGAIPLLLVVLGTGWYLVARARARSRRR